MRNLLLFLTAIVSFFVVLMFEMTELETSILMCVNFVVVLYGLWKINRLSPLFLFYITFSFLFIGGRFWGELFDETHHLWAGTFFYDYNVSLERQRDILCYILCFSYMLYCGYRLAFKRKKQFKLKDLSIESKCRLNGILKVCFYVIAVLSLYNSIILFKGALQYGYLSLYQNQANEFSGGSGFIQTLQFVFFGLALTYGDTVTKRMYIVLFIITSLIMILIGGRALFGSVLLFGLWFYSQKTNVSIRKIAMYGAGALFLLLTLSKLSIRYEDVYNDFSIFKTISDFFYEQGISMIVFDTSRDFEYPLIPYFNSFIPGSATIYNLMSGDTLEMYETTFSSFLAHSLSPSLYNEGYGLGWTFLSDFYLFSCKNIILFSIIVYLFGLFWGIVEKKSFYSPVYKVIIYASFLRLMMLPRAGSNTFFIIIVYTVVIHYILVAYIQGSYKTIDKNIKYGGR